MFDFRPFWENVSGQVIILLSIVALFLIIVGIVTQGFARTICTVLGVFVLIALILILNDAESIGNWIKDKIFNPNAGLVLYRKGMMETWNTITPENLSNLTRFTPFRF